MATQVTLNSGSVDSAGSLALKTNGTTTAVTINASQGVEFNAGAVGTPSITTTGDTNTGIFFPAADTIAFSEGGVEAMRLDSAGNMGLGVTPSPWGNGQKAIEMTWGNSVVSIGAGDIAVTQNAYFINPNFKYAATTDVGSSAYRQIDGTHRWFYAASGTAGNNITFTEAMRIDSGGALLVGATTNSGYRFYSASNSGTSYYPAGFNNTDSGSGSQIVIDISRNGARTGYITNTNNATGFTSTSDYRLKENVQPMQNALAKIAELKPCTYKWKSDGTDGQGFIAHELAEHFPDAVAGEKDAVDKDGVIQPQGIDTSFLVATLTAAIQEMKAIIDAQASTITQLQADVAALKGASA
jgi:hypothetical protein